MDYYKVLGISAEAGEQEIKTAYRKLAKKYHPDVVKDNKELTRKMYEIQEAYQVIGDTQKRKEYDESRKKTCATGKKERAHSGQQDGDGFTTNMSQFEQFFGFQAGRGMETYKDKKQQGTKPEGPIKPEEMFASFFGAGKR